MTMTDHVDPHPQVHRMIPRINIRTHSNNILQTLILPCALVLLCVVALVSGQQLIGPNFDASVPVTVTIVDYTNELAPVNRGNFNYDNEQPPLTFEHPWMNETVGGTSVVLSSGSVIWGEFEFGGMLLAMSPSHNAEGTSPVYQVLISAKPYGRWPTYPNRRTWNMTSDVTHPPAFKVELRNANGQLVDTIQMSDGLPINSPKLAQVRGGVGAPLRPFWHCGQMLKWQNAKTKESVNMRKWIGGYTIDSIRPSQGKQQASVNPAQGVSGYGMAASYQMNGLALWQSLPKWPLGVESYIWNTTYDVNHDPYLYNYNSATNSWINSVYGWGYEPGQPGGHDHLTGPGGPRTDRGPVASAYATYLADPSTTHLKSQTPIREVVEAWGDNYFNHGGYWIRDFKTFSSLPMSEVHSNRWAFLKAYYGTQLNEVPDGDPLGWDYDVPLYVASQGVYGKTPEQERAYYYDRDNRPFWNSWGWNVMSWLGTKTLSKPDFMYRTHAFRWHHITMNWIFANNHPVFGMDSLTLENRIHADLATIVDIFKRDHDNPQTLTDWAFNRLSSYLGNEPTWRNLGNSTNPILQHKLVLGQSSLGYYLSVNEKKIEARNNQKWLFDFESLHPLSHIDLVHGVVVSSGLWKRLRETPKSAIGLDFMMKKMDDYCFGKLVYGKERMEWSSPSITPFIDTDVVSFSKFTEADIPLSWEDWANKFPGSGPNEDMVHNDDGTFKVGYNEYAGSHAEVAWAKMRKEYYPEVAHPLLNQSVALVKSAYDSVEAHVLAVGAAQGPTYQRNADWIFRHPHLGFLEPPTVPSYVPEDHPPYVPPPPTTTPPSGGGTGSTPPPNAPIAPPGPTAQANDTRIPIVLTQPSGSGECFNSYSQTFARTANGTGIPGLQLFIRAYATDVNGIYREVNCTGVSKADGSVACNPSPPILGAWYMRGEFFGNSVYQPLTGPTGPLGVYYSLKTAIVQYTGPTTVAIGTNFTVTAHLPTGLPIRDLNSGNYLQPVINFIGPNGQTCSAQALPVVPSNPGGAYDASCSTIAPTVDNTNFWVNISLAINSVCDHYTGSVNSQVRVGTPPVSSSSSSTGSAVSSSSTGSAAGSASSTGSTTPSSSSSTGVSSAPSSSTGVSSSGTIPIVLSQPGGSGGCYNAYVGTTARLTNGTVVSGLLLTIKASGVDSFGVTQTANCSGISKADGTIYCNINPPSQGFAWYMHAEFSGNSNYTAAISPTGPLGVYYTPKVSSIQYTGPTSLSSGVVFIARTQLPVGLPIRENNSGKFIQPTMIFTTSNGQSCTAIAAPLNSSNLAGAYEATCEMIAPVVEGSFWLNVTFANNSICDHYSGRVDTSINVFNLAKMNNSIVSGTGTGSVIYMNGTVFVNYTTQIVSLQSGLDTVNQRVNSLQTSDASQTNQLASLNTQTNAQQLSLTSLQTQVNTINTTNTLITSQITSLQAGNSASIQRDDTMNQRINQLELSSTTQTNQLTSLQTQSTALQQTVNTIQDQLTTLNTVTSTQLAALQSNVSDIVTRDTIQTQQITQLQLSDASQSILLAAYQKNATILNDRINFLQDQITSLNGLLLQQEQSFIAQLNDAVGSLNQRIATLEQSTSSHQATFTSDINTLQSEVAVIEDKEARVAAVLAP